ncbi:MAG: sigma-E processing peptidase SpoIIGA, partial [Oscillospiraceae bacterium]|nr:sigma-E processing peptidase SpoIIGA [Oscillospiraceae bacterium]
MEIVYLDRFFLLNLLCDYLLCLVSARVCGLLLKRRRYWLAALLGAAYASAALLPGLRFLASAPGVLAAAALMALVAFGGERKPLRCGAVFLAV